ncbi:MAG TPA: peptidoglycan-binding protein [Fibrobacteria bacterium]|nr:peptidoglycan-binding protein [Fibrobacteria bacterium]
MAEFKATRKVLKKGLRLPIGPSHTVKVVNALPRVRLVGLFFDLNKSFLLPNAMPGIKAVKGLYEEHPDCNLLIVGHTDTSGNDDPNLNLSLERAEALSEYLREDVDAWEAFFHHSEDVKRWGTREIQLMLSALPKGGNPFFTGEASGAAGQATDAAVLAYQKSKGLKEDGKAGPDTRKALIRDYMLLDETKLPAGITVTTHGCGEFFPETATGDGVRNRDNRRVELFFFDGPIAPPPPAKKSKRSSPEYPQWLKQVTETVEVSADATEAADPLILTIFVEGDPPDTSGDLIFLGSDGKTTRIPISAMSPGEPGTVFAELDPSLLPDPVEIRRVSDSFVGTLLGPCSLASLSAALKADDADGAGKIAFAKPTLETEIESPIRTADPPTNEVFA